jgi:hypothetical protein
MGGRAQTQDFFRLFLIPGMHHCAGGPRPIYPYPVLARYSGSGDPKAASSFVPFDPTR